MDQSFRDLFEGLAQLGKSLTESIGALQKAAAAADAAHEDNMDVREHVLHLESMALQHGKELGELRTEIAAQSTEIAAQSKEIKQLRADIDEGGV